MAGVRFRAAALNASSSRRRGLWLLCGPQSGRDFSGKERERFARFSRKGCWVLRNKKPTSGREVGFGCECQLLLSYSTSWRAAARFVVVTWLICQEETACRRTKARGQPIWEAGADMVCSVQFMEFVIAGSVPRMSGHFLRSEQARFSSRGARKFFSRGRNFAGGLPCLPKQGRPKARPANNLPARLPSAIFCAPAGLRRCRPRRGGAAARSRRAGARCGRCPVSAGAERCRRPAGCG